MLRSLQLEILRTAAMWSPHLSLNCYNLLQESAGLIVQTHLQVCFKALGHQVSAPQLMQALDSIEMALAWLRLEAQASSVEAMSLAAGQQLYLEWVRRFHQYIDQALVATLEDMTRMLDQYLSTKSNPLESLYRVWSIAMQWGVGFHQHICLLRSSFLEVLAEGASDKQASFIILELHKCCTESLESLCTCTKARLSPLHAHLELCGSKPISAR